MKLICDLEVIAIAAENKQAENDRFTDFLKSSDSTEIDQAVADLSERVSARVDCTQCGNCCRSLMINVNENEADDVASHLALHREDFDHRFLEKGANGMILINRIPCHFLENNKCSIYEHRFAGCREFPGLHLPAVKKRLFSIFMHYGRCPIIFNVIESLKISTGFLPDQNQ